MKLDILTLFPDYFTGPLGQSMMRKATEQGLADLDVHDLRRWGIGPRRQVDDIPYGGGDGMVLRPEPLFAAFEALSQIPPAKAAGRAAQGDPQKASDGMLSNVHKPPVTKNTLSDQKPPLLQGNSHRIYLTPQGKPFGQRDAERLAHESHLIILCGHYEGIDNRVREELIDEELSIGDYVLTGGELPALVIVDAVVRLIPGVLGGKASADEETFSETLDGGLEYPHYTRPEIFEADGKTLKVPEVLLSGHHGAIKQWRKEQSAKLTAERRPDLAG